MKQIKSIMLAAALLASQAVPAIKVHTIGDSTMATYDENTTVTRGWGQMFQQFFTGGLTVNNRAKSGASSKSFYEEVAYWQSVKTQIEPGDYVLIQFAHNDEKNDGMDGDELKAGLIRPYSADWKWVALTRTRLSYEPFQLKAGSQAGFCLFLHDKDSLADKTGGKGLSITSEPGKPADRSPHLWPRMILK